MCDKKVNEETSVEHNFGRRLNEMQVTFRFLNELLIKQIWVLLFLVKKLNILFKRRSNFYESFCYSILFNIFNCRWLRFFEF